MPMPHEVLGLSPEADEADVRRRYLELVREFPPDRAPEQFAAIHAAYDELRDPVRRLRRRILEIHSRDSSCEQISARIRDRLRDARFPLAVLATLAETP